MAKGLKTKRLPDRLQKISDQYKKTIACFRQETVGSFCLCLLETVRSLADGPSWKEGAEGEVCILLSLGIAASPISLFSMGGICGRSLTAGKILFTRRQTCSLYLVL